MRNAITALPLVFKNKGGRKGGGERIFELWYI